MKKFKELTMGHHLLVGRKTFESIGRPLTGRDMIILTRDRNFRVDGCKVARSLDEAISFANDAGEDELFIGGGAEVYAQAIDIADRIYLTEVDAEVEADTFFPETYINVWTEVTSIRHMADETNQYPFTFTILERRPMQ